MLLSEREEEREKERERDGFPSLAWDSDIALDVICSIKLVRILGSRPSDLDSIPYGLISQLDFEISTRSCHHGFALVAAKRAHPDLNQGPADLQSAALTTELCTLLAETSDAFAFLGMHLAAWRQCD